MTKQGIPLDISERVVVITALEEEIKRNEHLAATAPGSHELDRRLERARVLRRALRKIKEAPIVRPALPADRARENAVLRVMPL